MPREFTRKEACELTGLTGGQVDYLCNKGIIVPRKIGSPRRPTVFYDWFQIIELKVISELKKRKISKEVLENLVRGLKPEDYSLDITKKYFLLCPDKKGFSKEVSQYLATLAGDGNLDFSDPSKVIVEVEVEDGQNENTRVFLLSEDYLRIGVIDLPIKFGHIAIELIPPVGDIFSQIREAGEKHHINVDEIVELAGVA